MSEFRVITDAVNDISGRLGGIAPEVSTFHGAVSGHAKAVSALCAGARAALLKPQITQWRSGARVI